MMGLGVGGEVCRGGGVGWGVVRGRLWEGGCGRGGVGGGGRGSVLT